MSTTQPPTPPAPPAPSPGLSHGLQIEYKAFMRPFTDNKKIGTLILLATCSYMITGFTIFFEEDSGKFSLMEQPPSGMFNHIVTYYSASWPTSGTLGRERFLRT